MCTLNRMPGSESVTWFSNEITGPVYTVVKEQPRFITKNTLKMTLERSLLIGSNPYANHVMIHGIIKLVKRVKAIDRKASKT